MKYTSNLSELYKKIEESQIPFDLIDCFDKVKNYTEGLCDLEIEVRVGIIFDCFTHDQKDKSDTLYDLTLFVCDHYEECRMLPRSKILSCYHQETTFDKMELTIDDMELTN